MNARRRWTPQTLVVLALVGSAFGPEASAAAAEPTTHEPGSGVTLGTGLSLGFRLAPASDAPSDAPEGEPDDGFAVEDESPEGDAPADGEPPDDGFAVEDESDEPIDEGTVVMPAAPSDDAPATDDDEGEWTFELEDISEDEGAIEEEVAAATVEATKGPSGTISGTLKDSVTGDPLVGAIVEVVGTKYKTKTDAKGEYALRVPPGTYELRLRGDASQPKRVSNVSVAQGDAVQLSRELQPLEGAGQVLEVEAEMNRESEGARLLQRKESASARDLMSRDEISKSGGGSTSAVARRIVGSTVVGGRYLFIRGLGHRYGNTLFDGARVPSPEPELRTVPLDIFPSGALSAINIQKTFSPDVPGDFAGGSTQLESRDVPDEFVFEVGADIGANTATTGRQMVTGAGFLGADAFGFGNLPRAIPEAMPTNYPVGPSVINEQLVPQWTPEQTERFGESLISDTRVRRGAVAPPNFGAKATAGYGFEYGHGGKFGLLASAGYKTKHSTLREQIRQFNVADGELVVDEPTIDYRGTKSTFNVAWSGIGLVKWRPNQDHRLSLLSFYSRDADDETRALTGSSRSVFTGGDVVNTRLRYVMRSVLMTRLGGQHTLPRARDLELDWFGSYAQARRDDPAMRDMVFTVNNAGSVDLDVTNGGGKQLFLDLTDHTESGALNLALPFEQWGQLKSKVKTGVWVEGKQRDFLVRRFAVGAIDGGSAPQGTGDVLSPDLIGGGVGPQPLFYRENYRPNDNYDATQEIYATYAQLDLPMVRWFRISGGARFEASFIDVSPYDYFARNRGEGSGVDPTSQVELRDYEVLPSLSLIFSPRDSMNVRLVGTRTLARPEFRELAPFQFTDFAGGETVQGNPNLTSSSIWNADLRWEWFPSVSEVVAVSVFYKRFTDPIERIAAALPGSRLVSFVNAVRAHNVGSELEVRKDLQFMGEAFEGFSLGANFAYVFSRVELPPQCSPDDPACDASVPDASTSRVRPLQGQSPFVANAYLDYVNEGSGTSARLLYNAFGRRIHQVGFLGLPDEYEEAIHNFDFVLGQEVHEGLTVSLGVENILNYPRRFTQGAQRAVTYLAWPGTTFTLGLTYKI
ncbi:MAG: TonB-dependent receptor [Myxococcales bacterium]|nr:TonB-dependent receptor [Myxococcales bacterium]